MNPDKGIYRVGGCVRDSILGREPKDIDYVVVGYTIDEFLDEHRTAIPIGKSFPVFLYEGSEYAFARVERKTGIGHNGFDVVCDPSITLKQDLGRRDFTINAMAAHRDTGEVYDPYGGFYDLQNKVIRHVGPAFVDDPLRLYRLARFASTYLFDVAPETMEAARAIPDEELLALPAERVCQESRKAMCGRWPTRYWELLQELGKLRVWHKELDDLVGVPAGPPQHHAEGDSFVHTMLTLSYFYQAPGEAEAPEVLRWAALLHDLGKGVTPREKWPSHPGHDEAGVPLVEVFCDRLRLPVAIKKAAVLACREHMRVHVFLDMKKGKWVDLVQAAEKTCIGAKGLSEVCKADTLGRVSDHYDTEGAHALAAVVETVKKTTGQPIPASLQGKNIGLHVRNAKGAAAKRKLRELGFFPRKS